MTTRVVCRRGARANKPLWRGVRAMAERVLLALGTTMLVVAAVAVALLFIPPLRSTFENWLFHDSGGRGCYGVNCRTCDDADFGCTPGRRVDPPSPGPVTPPTWLTDRERLDAACGVGAAGRIWWDPAAETSRIECG